MITRFTGRPVSGSVFNGSSIIDCFTSKRRTSSPGFSGTVSYT